MKQKLIKKEIKESGDIIKKYPTIHISTTHFMLGRLNEYCRVSGRSKTDTVKQLIEEGIGQLETRVGIVRGIKTT